MSNKSGNPLSPFLNVVEGLPQFLTDPDLVFLMETGYVRRRMSGLVERLDELAELRRRAQSGETLDGDAFRALRLLSSFSKSELVCVLMELGLPNDADALLSWRLDLNRRSPSRHDRMTEQTRKRVDHRLSKQRKQDAIVKRITLARMNMGVTLEEAYEIVAKGHDVRGGGLLGEYLEPPAMSVATVKSYFMAGMRRLKPQGYVEYKANALIGGGYRKLYFGDLARKGRRPRKK